MSKTEKILNVLSSGHFWKRMGQLAIALFILGVISIIVFFMMVRGGSFGELPVNTDLKNIQHQLASEVYSVDGKLLGKYFVQNRTQVDYEDISPNVINALVATEDARFFEHRGLDLRALARVFFKTLLMRDQSAGGGSTLSQQLAKNLYPRKKHKRGTIIINKTKEMILARRLEKLYTKEELLGHYLNTVPFSRNIFGVEVAAKTFFNVKASELKVEEAAVLVGMLKATSNYDPVRNPERATDRRNTVLSQMAKYKYITNREYVELKEIPLQVQYYKEDNNTGIGTYFREFLRQELDQIMKDHERKTGETYNIYTDGLKIYTSIHSEMQKYAEEAVAERMSGLQKDFDKSWGSSKPWEANRVLIPEMKKSNRYKTLKKQGYSEEGIKNRFNRPVKMKVFSHAGGEMEKTMTPMDSIKYYYGLLNAGFMVMDPKNGEVRAWVGGTNHKYFKYDHVKSRRQVGSTFKPIVYLQAIREGIPPCELIPNRLVTYTEFDNWQPQNSDDNYTGYYTMKGGLTGSVNTIAVDLIMRTGTEAVRNLAFLMGIESEIPPGPAIALGTADIALYDMIKVYGTIANRGLKPEPKFLLRIETQDGENIIDNEEDVVMQRIVQEEHADMMIKIMESVVDSGTATRLRRVYNFENDIAGKTGTTQSHADGWFMGFTPSLVAGAWVGGESPRVRFKSIRYGQGANMALPIWAIFMKKLQSNPEFAYMKTEQFPEPDSILLAQVTCPNYVKYSEPVYKDPVPTADTEDDDKPGSFLEVLKQKPKKNKDKEGKPPVYKDKDKNKTYKPGSYEERQKQAKKDARKKKRKKFFDKVFGSGND